MDAGALLEIQEFKSVVSYASIWIRRQRFFTGTKIAKADCPVTERLCKTVLSLPMHPYLTKEVVEEVTEKIKRLL